MAQLSRPAGGLKSSSGGGTGGGVKREGGLDWFVLKRPNHSDAAADARSSADVRSASSSAGAAMASSTSASVLSSRSTAKPRGSMRGSYRCASAMTVSSPGKQVSFLF